MWVIAIYSDDLVCDIRDDFKDLIGDGHNSEQATILLEKEYQDIIKDSTPVFCFALVYNQYRTKMMKNK